MKNVIFIGLWILASSCTSCRAQTDKVQPVSTLSGNDVDVYYFHLTTRCVTCLAVESETRKNLEILYPEQVREGKISFLAINLETESGKAFGERLGVKSQALMLVKGDRKINLTNEGFLYAVSKPDKFRDIIKERINQLNK